MQQLHKNLLIASCCLKMNSSIGIISVPLWFWTTDISSPMLFMSVKNYNKQSEWLNWLLNDPVDESLTECKKRVKHWFMYVQHSSQTTVNVQYNGMGKRADQLALTSIRTYSIYLREKRMQGVNIKHYIDFQG